MLFQILGGLALLFVGGEFLVRGAASLAARLGVSPLLIGIAVVGFGTSVPELVTSVEASLHGSPGIAIGNVVGSNISNLLLILGAVALIAAVPIARKRFARDAVFLIGSTAALMYFAYHGGITPMVATWFLLGLGAYLIVAYATEPRSIYLAQDQPHAGPLVSVVTLGAGIAGTVLGASLLVGGAIALARSYAISESVIGVTLVAVGTSLPELAASLVATVRRHGDIAVGNIIGSNIFNVLGILGAVGLLGPMSFPQESLDLDIWVMLGATVAVVLFAITGSRISRFEGLVMLAGYAGFITYLAIANLGP